jgi:hypothetical protein
MFVAIWNGAVQGRFPQAPKVRHMRICIYKADESPDLTLLLREGTTMPDDAKDVNWIQFKIVTRGEMRGDLLAKLEPTGHCVVELGEMSRRDRGNQSPKITPMKNGIYRGRRFPSFLGRMSRI